MIEQFKTCLTSRVHIAPLVIYRILFGFSLTFSAVRMIVQDRIAFNYATKMRFSYFGFEWVQPLPYDWYPPLFVLLGFSGIAISIGFFYRFFAVTHFFLFTYLELIDKSLYLNHYYFVSLMSFIHIFLPSGRFFSIDSLLFPQIKVSHVPNWLTWIVKGQIAIVYVYAGLCKINADWLLNAQPLKIWLPPRDDLFMIGPL
ncbi:MAG: HTTM domain-containing protein, partial [Cytophagales bacterium]